MRFLCKIIFPVLAVLTFSGALTINAQEKGKIVSGDYDGVLIGIDKSGKLTGYYDSGTGDDGNGNPRFTCTFFISGNRQSDGSYKIKTWYPEEPDEVVEGEIKYVKFNGKPAINLHMNGEHGGCWNVAPVLKEAEGVDYELSKAGSWESIRMISPKRVYLFKSMDAKAPQKIYVVKNDPVRVLQTNGDWAEIVFVSDSGKQTKGWVKTNDFYSSVR